MPAFSGRSAHKLSSCHKDLQDIFYEVIKHFDCTILCGHRSAEEQDRYFDEGKSKLRWPNSRHNKLPSEAVDVAPYPIDWEDVGRFRYFAGFVMGIAASMGVKLRWGGDWDRDTEVKDNKFNDLPHFEIDQRGP